MTTADTIAAVATAPGRGGIGVVRVSGPAVPAIAVNLLGTEPAPRLAEFRSFRDTDGSVIDRGLAIYFPAPRSYTGEPVLELHAHGSPVVLDQLLRRLLTIGARLARPGEFTERAFLNGKLDLAQAEAVADLIDSATASAARSAQRALSGEFSRLIDELTEALGALRIYVEASIDFVDEEIDFLSAGGIAGRLAALQENLHAIERAAKQGCLLREGMTVVIAGRPNAGKSSLLNRLAERDLAIVTASAGTTRDLLQTQLQVDGMPLRVIDTAGLRDSDDPIEQEGIRRARAAIGNADRVLWMIDASSAESDDGADLPSGVPVTRVYNKIDLSGHLAELCEHDNPPWVRLSLKTGDGVGLLRGHLKSLMGFSAETDSSFTARRRHLDALTRAKIAIAAATVHLRDNTAELLAEELRLAQDALGEITGAVSSDDLLGQIFSSFCIGK